MSPTRLALGVLAGWLLLGLVAAALPAAAPAWQLAGAGLLLIAAIDVVRVGRSPLPEVERALPSSLSIGVATTVVLHVRNETGRSLRLRLFDHHPPALRAEGLPLSLELPDGARSEPRYRVWPLARGSQRFGRVELRLRSPLGLFERHARAGHAEEVRVYPNFRAAAGYELLAADDRTGAIGIRRHPRRGEGLEFRQLREYRSGDSLRQIDWKATARLRKTISREYQDERDQQVVFLLDCGRRLHTKDGERSHFDAALDALLLTAHVAHRQGDAVGLMTFSGERRWLAPRKGVGQLQALLNAVHDLETGPRAADFGAAARELVARIRKRALVVLISNVRDDDADELRGALRLLARRHLVLLASLRESVLAETLRSPVRRLDDALRASSVHLYLEQRRVALESLRHEGALLVDSEPPGLPVSLVNRYLQVKAAGVL